MVSQVISVIAPENDYGFIDYSLSLKFVKKFSYLSIDIGDAGVICVDYPSLCRLIQMLCVLIALK
ncbi:hypothetical protein SDC9_119206 [bioreactor metagenome]|uniref:Uncharacterized protein n=1 Tax=bioreactor metagenome TaxID=1076179 RepID=A0A645C8K4_9ZZZZ